jgi:N-acetylglutamate synthase-like GNAT family acetyltransferase
VSPPDALTGLREVRDADSAALTELIGGCWAEYPGIVLAVDEEEPWLRRPATYYARSGATARMWVVDDRQGLAACVGVKPLEDGATAELKSLYVAAWARHRGLGAGLVDVVERYAVAHGARTVRLWSDSRFADAHRLYTKLGYRRSGQRDLHDLSDTTEYGFVKLLGPDVGTGDDTDR